MLFFTADLHLGHQNIIEYCDRPFGGVDHMNDEIIRRWNETVSDHDHVWILGDFAMGKITETLPLARRLNGHKYLLLGNHDRPWSGSRKPEKWVRRYVEVGFMITNGPVVLPLGGEPWMLSHFPYKGDSHDSDRFTEHRPVDIGLPLLHGHVHDSWTVNGRQVNVGVDVWDFRPVTFSQILEETSCRSDM